MSRRLRVLQIQPKYYIRENDLHEEIVKGLPREEFEVTSAYMREKPVKGDLLSVSEHVKYFNFTKKQMKGLRIKALSELYKYCEESKFDAVIAHRFKACDLMMTLNKKLKIPRCIGVNHGFGDYDRLYRRFMLKMRLDDAWRFVAVSDPVRDSLLSLRSGFNQDNVLTINNAIDIKRITEGFSDRQELQNIFGVSDDDFVIGTVGRMVEVKGHIYLLKAFKKLHDANKRAKLFIFGDGNKRQEAEEFISQNGLSSSVFLQGHVESAYKFMPVFDVFALSSLSEGLPLSVMEAMAANLPVVSTDVGGVSNLLGDKGRLIAPKDIEGLYHALADIMYMQDRSTIGKELNLKLKKEYSIESYRASYRDLLVS